MKTTDRIEAKRLKPNLKLARRHLRALDPRPDAQFTFQTFSDSAKENGYALTRVLHGTLKEHARTLIRLNRSGAGIFVTVNETDGLGRSERNIVAIRAVFADKDNGALPRLPIEPTLIVESKNGDHPYWVLNTRIDLSLFRKIQKAIIRKLDSDKKVCDPPRVMRLAGFFHLKNPDDPFLVRIRSRSSAKYSSEELLTAFPAEAERKAEPKTYKNDRVQPAKDPLRHSFEKWASLLPTQVGAENPLGGRNSTLLLLIREGLGCGVPEDRIQRVSRDYCRRANEPEEVADKMLKRQIAQHHSSPFLSYYIEAGQDEWTPAEVSINYLVERGFDDGEFLRLRFYKNDFYRYTGERYLRISQPDLHADVMAYLQNKASLREQAEISFANNVIANLKGRTLVPETNTVPSFLSKPKLGGSRLIPLKNGILDLSRAIDGVRGAMIPHTPDFFSTTCLPFEFDANAKCPTWRRFLKRALPDRSQRRFVQEWSGYNLVFDTKFHKFVLLIGEGANGKTVFCVVLRALLGAENVSAVALEQFNPGRTFPLAAMTGKLANIVEEMSEVDKVAEGVLKDFVAGGTMTIERKHRDPFETQATARLTFATNVLPRFRDRSSGLWRRMVPVPFLVQIPEAEQDRRLVDTGWWQESNELPGVFNWALRGLARLNERGRFEVPKSSRDLLEEYRADANPAMSFLREKLVARKGASISSSALYHLYKHWAESHGNKPLGQGQFSKEVPKAFPHAQLTKNARWQNDGTRSRVWIGIVEITQDNEEVDSL